MIDTKTVADAVEKKLLDRGDRGGRSVRVDREMIRCEDDWVYVVVTPTGANGSASVLVDLFEEVESELENEHGWHVMIVPARPEE